MKNVKTITKTLPWDQADDIVDDQTREQVCWTINNQLWDQVYMQIRDQIFTNVWGEIKEVKL
jgi:hypothetical protein